MAAEAQAASSEPAPDELYETRGTLKGKWPMLARPATWIGLFIFAFMWLMVNFIEPLPHWHIRPHAPRKPADWWLGLVVSLGTGLFVAAVFIVAFVLGIRAHAFRISSDRLRVHAGWHNWDLLFQDIIAVERVSFAPWPHLSTFWQDLKRETETELLTPRYQHVGLGQTLTPGATYVLVKVSGRRWWRGYFLDVDNPDEFLEALNQALARFQASRAQAQQHSASNAAK
jgi:hypothetical protein